jgi:hypothetical protein
MINDYSTSNAYQNSHCSQHFYVQNKWIVSDCKNIQIIAERSRLILMNWDEHVILSTTGQSLEDSYCVPQNTVIIEGRCRDFTALRTRKSSIKNRNSSAEHDFDTGFRFGLLKSFTPLTAVASITQNVTIRINSLSDLNAVEGLNLFSAKDSLHTKQLLDYLKKNDVSALFCADSVSDDLIYSVALTGVVLVSYLSIYTIISSSSYLLDSSLLHRMRPTIFFFHLFHYSFNNSFD